jgi:hypothetical protein
MWQLLTGVNLKILGLSYGEDEYTKIGPVFEKYNSRYLYTADIDMIYELRQISFCLSLTDIIPADVVLSKEKSNKTESEINNKFCS